MTALALVATFPSFAARGAIRELGKVLGLPPAEIERVARRRRTASGHFRRVEIARRLERDMETAGNPPSRGHRPPAAGIGS